MSSELVPVTPASLAGEAEWPVAEPLDRVRALERGLDVLQAFSGETPSLTLTEVARLTGLSRATARRILHTLRHLGHVTVEDRRFALTPRVLSLGWAYLSSLSLWEIATPYLEELAVESGESCAASTLALPDIVCVARASSRRIMDPRLELGARLPVHATSAGRVLLADLPDDELDRFLAGAALEPLTDRTITEPARLREAVLGTRARGWALVDQELEVGLRSIAVPIRAADGSAVAALNLASAAGRVDLEELRARILPSLQATAATLSGAVARLPQTVAAAVREAR